MFLDQSVRFGWMTDSSVTRVAGVMGAWPKRVPLTSAPDRRLQVCVLTSSSSIGSKQVFASAHLSSRITR